MKSKTNNLHGVAQFVLFVSSYSPLFFLLIVKQISANYNYLNWAGFKLNTIIVFLSKFGLSTVLITVTIIGLFGYFRTLGNIEEVAKNGLPIKVLDVKNKNSEAIGYIATYIIPFLFEDLSGWYECFAVLFLLLIIYRIYINSSLLLINPLLSFSYGIYEIEYLQNDQAKNALIVSRDKNLTENTKIKIYEIGHKLYFAINNHEL